MPMSAYFWLWQTRPPDSPTRPLLIVSASSFAIFASMPSARTISSLFPVARSAQPISVPNSQYKNTITRTPIKIPITRETIVCLKLNHSTILEKIVSTFKSGTLLFPIILRLMDQSPICVKIPARIAGMSKSVCKSPVTAPASIPASVEITRASSGSIPLSTTSTAQIQPPSAKLPSTVKSAMSKILYVM